MPNTEHDPYNGEYDRALLKNARDRMAAPAAGALLLRGGQVAALLAALLLVLAGCGGPPPIRIGYVGELTGKRAELGVSGRDAALLAVEAINARGGLNHRPVELLVRNDEGDPEVARRVDAELAAAGVVAIIGHVTSEQTAAVLDQVNRSHMVLMSATSASSRFSRQADYFFRVTSSNDFFGQALAVHIYRARGVRRLTGIYDLRNRAFSETLWQSITAEFERQGGAVDALPFESGRTDLAALMGRVAAGQPAGVVFIASAVDTALMIQYGRRQGLAAPLFSSSWAQTEELLQKGGQAVEGLELIAIYHPQNPFPAFRPFVEQFEARYHRPPTLAAPYTYEAVMVLAAALQQTGGQSAGLPEALAQIKNFEGVQGYISFDAYGDVQREAYIAVVRDGQFQIISTVAPAPEEPGLMRPAKVEP